MISSRNVKAPHLLWLGVFAVWGFLLSGVIKSSGAPGILQAFHVKTLLESKEAEQTQIETEIARLENDVERLNKSTYAQEVEVRKNLGYIADDEIVFEFSSTQSPEKK